MWKQPGRHHSIHSSQLVVGLYVWLDLKWNEHPFLTSRFLIRSEKDIGIIRALDTKRRLYYYPDQSTATPAPAASELQAASAESAEFAQEKVAIAQELKLLEKSKLAKLRSQKDAAIRADRAWEKAAQATREALLNMSRSPKVAGEQMAKLSQETAAAIAQGEEILLHLLGDKKEQGPQFHAINVMTLCMLVGKKLRLTERELTDLALAALAHDCGKTEIPAQILRIARRKKHEEDFYRQHVNFSAMFAAKSGAFSAEALAAISDHHEAADGSGWPKGKKDASRCTRILALVNRYDRLCSPESADGTPLMPAEALATMFRNESSKHDLPLLTALIKLLGVFPPGTVVQLSDGALAMVVSPGSSSLQPKVLIYCPEMSKDEAPTLDLHAETDLKIIEAIRPSALPPDVLKWLNPQQRLSYFFSVDDGRTKG